MVLAVSASTARATGDRVDRVRLAHPAPVGPVGAVDLDHGDPAGRQVTGQARAERNRCPPPPTFEDFPKTPQPRHKRRITPGANRELTITEQCAGRDVHHRAVMGALVGIHATDDLAWLAHRCHARTAVLFSNR